MATRQTLIQVLRNSGIDSDEEAAQLAAIAPANGNTWTAEVLNGGKVDEQKFATSLAALFKTPLENIEASKVDRTALGLLPSRFVFKHQILPLAATETMAKLATYDVFNSVARRLAQQQLPGRKLEWVIVPRGQLIRAIKTVYGVGAETFEEILQSTRTYDGEEREQSQDITTDDPEA